MFPLLDADGQAVLLVNPQPSKAVGGRKTDGRESKWLAALRRHGLLPPRVLPRDRKAVGRARTHQGNRLPQGREAATIKRAAVATDMRGVRRSRRPG